MGAPVSERGWWPRTPPLPEDLARLVGPDDPEWFAREMAIAASPVVALALRRAGPPGWWHLRTIEALGEIPRSCAAGRFHGQPHRETSTCP